MFLKTTFLLRSHFPAITAGCSSVPLFPFASGGEQTGGHRHAGVVHWPHVCHRSPHPHPPHYLLHPEEQGREISWWVKANDPSNSSDLLWAVKVKVNCVWLLFQSFLNLEWMFQRFRCANFHCQEKKLLWFVLKWENAWTRCSIWHFFSSFVMNYKLHFDLNWQQEWRCSIHEYFDVLYICSMYLLSWRGALAPPIFFSSVKEKEDAHTDPEFQPMKDDDCTFGEYRWEMVLRVPRAHFTHHPLPRPCFTPRLDQSGWAGALHSFPPLNPHSWPLTDTGSEEEEMPPPVWTSPPLKHRFFLPGLWTSWMAHDRSTGTVCVLNRPMWCLWGSRILQVLIIIIIFHNQTVTKTNKHKPDSFTVFLRSQSIESDNLLR